MPAKLKQRPQRLAKKRPLSFAAQKRKSQRLSKTIKENKWLTLKDKQFLIKQGTSYTSQHMKKLKRIREKIQYSEHIPIQILDIVERHFLPKLPEKHLENFFRYWLPTMLGYKPTPKQLQTIGEYVLPKIPQRQIMYFFVGTLPITLRHNPTPRQLKIIAQHILPKMRKSIRADFFRYDFPKLLQRKPTPQQLDAIVYHILPKIPSKGIVGFFNALPETIRPNPTPQQLKKVWDAITADILPNITESKIGINLFFSSLEKTLSCNPTPQQLKIIGKHILPNTPPAQFELLFEKTIPKMLQTNPTPKQLTELWETQGEHLTHRLYRNRDIDFFNPSVDVKRKKMKKTGPPTILLGGKLTGKAIIRIIPETAFEAWKKAEQAGIPVEPILKKVDKRTGETKDRAYSTKKGNMRVSTRVIKGQNLKEIINSISEKQAEEIYHQVVGILTDLWSNNISHRHPHESNFIIDLKGKKPKVYLIDFDDATVMKTQAELLDKISTREKNAGRKEINYAITTLHTLSRIMNTPFKTVDEIQKELLYKLKKKVQEKLLN